MILSTQDPAVRLRPWAASDHDALVRYGNNKLVWCNLTDMFPHPYTDADAVAWVKTANEPGPSIFLAIDLEGEAIGGVGVIAGQGNSFHTGQFGYWLGQPHWGKGIATRCA